MSILASEREALSRAFKLMRSHGLVARQRFMCCGSCAGARVADDVADMPEARRARVKGAAYFTRQDWSNLLDERQDARGVPNEMWIGYGQVETKEHGPVGLPDAEVGLAVAFALQAEGLTAEWDGDPAHKIRVVFK